MQISLPDQLESFVKQQTRVGGYSSPDDWIAKVVKTMQQEARELEQAIDKGIKSCDAGRKVPMEQAFGSAREKLKSRYNV